MVEPQDYTYILFLYTLYFIYNVCLAALHDAIQASILGLINEVARPAKPLQQLMHSTDSF